MNAMPKIEKQVLIPSVKTIAEPIFPFDQMKTGDSFFVPAGNGPLDKYRLHGYINSYKSKCKSYLEGAIFMLRSVEGGVRVWCIQEAHHIRQNAA